MGKVTLDAKHFTDLLKLAKATAYGKPNDDPILASAYITTEKRGADGDVIAAITSDGQHHGEVIFPCEGTFDSDFVMDLSGSSWINSMVRTAKQRMRKLAPNDARFTVELSVVSAIGPDSGAALRVQTLTDGVPGEWDSQAEATVMDAREYNLTGVVEDLRGRGISRVQKDGHDLPEGRMTPMSGSALSTLSKVARITTEPMYLYPTGHKASRQVVTSGEHWRGSIAGCVYPQPGEGEAVDLEVPFVDLVVPRGVAD